VQQAAGVKISTSPVGEPLRISPWPEAAKTSVFRHTPASESTGLFPRCAGASVLPQRHLQVEKNKGKEKRQLFPLENCEEFDIL
jgi:hypothetical protein